MSFQVAAEVPLGYTGWLSGREETCSILTPDFLKVVNNFTIGAKTTIIETGCKGVCRGVVQAAGFVTNCSSSEAEFSILPSVDANGNYVTGNETLM